MPNRLDVVAILTPNHRRIARPWRKRAANWQAPAPPRSVFMSVAENHRLWLSSARSFQSHTSATSVLLSIPHEISELQRDACFASLARYVPTRWVLKDNAIRQLSFPRYGNPLLLLN